MLLWGSLLLYSQNYLLRLWITLEKCLNYFEVSKISVVILFMCVSARHCGPVIMGSGVQHLLSFTINDFSVNHLERE